MLTALGNKANLDAAVESAGDAAQHREGVPRVVGVLKTADHRGGGANQLGECPLGEASLGAELVDLAGDLGVGTLFFEKSQHLWLPREVAPVKDLDRIGGRFAFLGHCGLWSAARTTHPATVSNIANRVKRPRGALR